MSRIRTIKPEFFTSETLGRVELGARLLFAGLWTQADDEGRLKDQPAVLRGALFPWDDAIQTGNVDQWLAVLDSFGLIQRYEVDGRGFISITAFAEHQRVNRPTPSQLPAPPDLGEREPVGGLTEESLRAHGAVDEGSLGERKGREGKGKQTPSPGDAEIVRLPAPRARLSPSVIETSFNRWWAAYPRKVGKLAARKAYDRATKGAEPEEIARALQAALPELRKKDTQYIPHPATWLNEGRWMDETGAAGAPRTARCFSCGRDVAEGEGCPIGEAQEFCDRWEWTHAQVPHVQDGHGA